jgi:hypothetical protein
VVAAFAESVIDIVSPSMLERLDCPARVAYGQQHPGGGGGQNQAALLGDLVHRAMEFVVVENHEPGEAWEQAVADFGASGHPVSGILGLGRIRARFRRGAVAVSELLGIVPPTAEPASEIELVSECGTVRGTPDLVWFGDAGLIVIDYKSGFVSGAEGTKPGYVRQLHLYSALASSHYGRPVARAILFSFKQGVVDVPIDEGAMTTAMGLAREMRESFNSRVPGIQPAVASETTCTWCVHQPKCGEFFDAFDKGELGGAGVEALRGTVTRPVERSQAGNGVMLEREGQPGQVALVARVPDAVLAGVSPGSTVAFSSLRRRGDDAEEKYEWAPRRSRACVGPLP